MAFREYSNRFNKIFLFGNELVTKSYSFILFWFLGIRLSGHELTEFLLEMPFIFIFSTVLSFGAPTFFLDQKKTDAGNFKEQLGFALSFVLIINLIIVIAVFGCFRLNFISFDHFLLVCVASSLNINTILTEYFFVSKKYLNMIVTTIIPKLLFFIGLLFLSDLNLINKKIVYILILFSHLIGSFQVLFNLRRKLSWQRVITYCQFSWLLTLQPILIYVSYVSFRYFINITDESSYLIEFSILQTFMGFYAFLISVANRFLIHDLYDELISKIPSKTLARKFYVFEKVFFLVSFVFLNIVVYYSNVKKESEVSSELFWGIFFISVASLINYISQFYKSMLIFDKKFAFLLKISFVTALITIFMTYLCSIIKINTLYPLSIIIINFMVFVIYRSKIDLSFFNELIPLRFMLKVIILLAVLSLAEYVIYSQMFYVSVVNVIIFILILLDLGILFFREKSSYLKDLL